MIRRTLAAGAAALALLAPTATPAQADTVTEQGSCRTYWAHAFPHQNWGLWYSKQYIESHFGCTGVTQMVFKDKRGDWNLRKYYLGPANSPYAFDYRVVWYNYKAVNGTWLASWVKVTR